MTDFPRLLKLLDESKVEFILVGGAAATAHGATRLTQDVDIVYQRTDDNLARIVEALRDTNPYLRGVPAGLPFQWDVGFLDLLGEITAGGKFDDLLPHTVELHVFGVDCRCLDLETLIRVKRAAGRARDLEAIAELETLHEEQTDSENR